MRPGRHRRVVSAVRRDRHLDRVHVRWFRDQVMAEDVERPLSANGQTLRSGVGPVRWCPVRIMSRRVVGPVAGQRPAYPGRLRATESFGTQFLPTQRIVPKVDDVPMVSVSRARVHLLSTDVGKDRLPTARLFFDESVHLRERRGDPCRVGIVEGETHSENVAAHEALARGCLETRRIVVCPSVKEERGDRVRRFTVEELHTEEVPLMHVKDAHHHRSESRPLHTPPRLKYLAAVVTDPAQTRRARVPLGDGVGRDQTGCAAGT